MQSQQTSHAEHMYDLLGLPCRDGRLSWPLGLRVLPNTGQVETLQRQLEALIQLATAQAALGAVDPRVTDMARDNVKQLRREFADCEVNLAEPRRMESRRFLNKLDKALDQLHPTASR